MKNTQLVSAKLAAIAAAATLVSVFSIGCAAADVEEEQGDNQSELKASCASSIPDPVGSDEWRAALKQCIANAGANGSSGCSVSVQCVNGACKCGSGPNANKSCNGSGKGADSCSSICSSCSGAKAPAPGGGAKPPPNATPGGGGGGSCSVTIRCSNNSCVCGNGASCDGSTATGAGSCSVKCRSAGCN